MLYDRINNIRNRSVADLTGRTAERGVILGATTEILDLARSSAKRYASCRLRPAIAALAEHTVHVHTHVRTAATVAAVLDHLLGNI